MAFFDTDALSSGFVSPDASSALIKEKQSIGHIRRHARKEPVQYSHRSVTECEEINEQTKYSETDHRHVDGMSGEDVIGFNSACYNHRQKDDHILFDIYLGGIYGHYDENDKAHKEYSVADDPVICLPDIREQSEV